MSDQILVKAALEDILNPKYSEINLMEAFHAERDPDVAYSGIVDYQFADYSDCTAAGGGRIELAKLNSLGFYNLLEAIRSSYNCSHPPSMNTLVVMQFSPLNTQEDSLDFFRRKMF